MVSVSAIGSTAAVAGKIVAYGALLGLGFWISKRITGYVDEKFMLYDYDLLDRVGREPVGRVSPLDHDGGREVPA